MTVTASIFEDMRAWRQDFHAHPELGFEEHRTSAKVAELLRQFGLEVHTGIGGTGVVGVLQRGNGTTAIGLRADMDALPFEEQNDFDHRSTNPGVMHACGHDGHTAMLLGAAKHLSEILARQRLAAGIQTDALGARRHLGEKRLRLRVPA